MNYLRLITLLLLTIFVSFTLAQDFRLGFRLESNSVIVRETETDNTKMIINEPTSIGVNLSCIPISKLALDLRAGFDFNAAYSTGYEIGFFAKYLIADPVFAAGGVFFHDVFARKGSSVKAYTNAMVFFPSMGFGINLNEHLILEFTALYGNRFKAGRTERRSENIPGVFDLFPVELNWITKLGISYSFGL